MCKVDGKICPIARQLSCQLNLHSTTYSLCRYNRNKLYRNNSSSIAVCNHLQHQHVTALQNLALSCLLTCETHLFFPDLRYHFWVSHIAIASWRIHPFPLFHSCVLWLIPLPTATNWRVPRVAVSKWPTLALNFTLTLLGSILFSKSHFLHTCMLTFIFLLESRQLGKV